MFTVSDLAIFTTIFTFLDSTSEYIQIIVYLDEDIFRFVLWFEVINVYPHYFIFAPLCTDKA